MHADKIKVLVADDSQVTRMLLVQLLSSDPGIQVIGVVNDGQAALDFLDAPARLTRFLDHRLYRLLTVPTRGPLRAVNAAAQGFVRTLAKVVGAEAIDDAITFFKAFEGMDRGFRERADAVARLLTDQSTAS